MKLVKWFGGAAGVALSGGLAISTYLDHVKHSHKAVQLTDEALASLKAHEQTARQAAAVDLPTALEKTITMNIKTAPEETRDEIYRKATLKVLIQDFDQARTQTGKMEILADIFKTLHNDLDQAGTIGLTPEELKQMLHHQGKQAFQEMKGLSPATELDRYVLQHDMIQAWLMSGTEGGNKYDASEAENATGKNLNELHQALKSQEELAASQAGREIRTFAASDETFSRLNLDEIKRQRLAYLAIYDVGNNPFRPLRQDQYLQSIGVSQRTFDNIPLYWNKLKSQKEFLQEPRVEAAAAEMFARSDEAARAARELSPFDPVKVNVPRP